MDTVLPNLTNVQRDRISNRAIIVQGNRRLCQDGITNNQTNDDEDDYNLGGDCGDDDD